MEHYVILHNQVPRYVHRDLCYAAMAKYVALHNATYLAIATVFGPKNQELLMDDTEDMESSDDDSMESGVISSAGEEDSEPELDTDDNGYDSL